MTAVPSSPTSAIIGLISRSTHVASLVRYKQENHHERRGQGTAVGMVRLVGAPNRPQDDRSPVCVDTKGRTDRHRESTTHDTKQHLLAKRAKTPHQKYLRDFIHITCKQGNDSFRATSRNVHTRYSAPSAMPEAEDFRVNTKHTPHTPMCRHCGRFGFSTCDVRSRTFGARQTIVLPPAPPGVSKIFPFLSPKAEPPRPVQARQAPPSALPASTPAFPGELHVSETGPVTKTNYIAYGSKKRGVLVLRRVQSTPPPFAVTLSIGRRSPLGRTLRGFRTVRRGVGQRQTHELQRRTTEIDWLTRSSCSRPGAHPLVIVLLRRTSVNSQGHPCRFNAFL